jgi:hypothetical protein
MKSLALVSVLGGLLTAGALMAESVSFPAGTFENGTAANWMPQTTGTAVANTPNDGGNIVGQVSITGTGTGSLSTSAQAAYQPQSLYVISVDVKFASLAGASTEIGVAALDGNDAVVKELTQSQIINALGINLLTVVPSLTTQLTALVGKLELQDTLQKLLALIDGDPAALNATQQLVDSLVGANGSTLSALQDLLNGVLNGTIDPNTITSLEISQLLGVAQASPIVTNLQAVLASIGGDDSAVEALANLAGVLAGTPGDTTLVDNLLTTLIGADGLVGNVADILQYALSDPGLLSTLTDTLTQSLLGIANPAGGGSFQTVKLIFSTGTTPPTGAIGIRLSSGATLGVGQTVSFDNVKIDRFDLAVAPGSGAVSSQAPLLKVLGKRAKKTSASRLVVKGTAVAFGASNRIAKVEYKLGGSGAPFKTRSFRKARGTEKWKIVLKPIDGDFRVKIRAVDATGRRSASKTVRVVDLSD